VGGQDAERKCSWLRCLGPVGRGSFEVCLFILALVLVSGLCDLGRGRVVEVIGARVFRAGWRCDTAWFRVRF